MLLSTLGKSVNAKARRNSLEDVVSAVSINFFKIKRKEIKKEKYGHKLKQRLNSNSV